MQYIEAAYGHEQSVEREGGLRACSQLLQEIYPMLYTAVQNSDALVRDQRSTRNQFHRLCLVCCPCPSIEALWWRPVLPCLEQVRLSRLGQPPHGGIQSGTDSPMHLALLGIRLLAIKLTAICRSGLSGEWGTLACTFPHHRLSPPLQDKDPCSWLR